MIYKDENIRKSLELHGKDLLFLEEPHEYWNEGVLMKSATTLLKNFFPFPREAAADAALAGRNPRYKDCTTREEVWELWEQKAQLGTDLHQMCEDYLNGEFITIDTPQQMVAFNYLRKKKFEDVITEVKVVAKEWGVAGMVDALVKIDGKWWLYDWKTDKRVDMENSDRKFKKNMEEHEFYCPGILYGFDNCNYNKYTFQLGIYRMILETVYDIDIAGAVVVHFDEAKMKAVEYPLQYHADYVAMILKKRYDEFKNENKN